ncbi:cellulose binding domain-containing protein [Actinoplanes sp. URMC 104]|uniref:cellulose binding domain-containing protein n=1 Tax=Actinoplanes sp. URMC 104 TaxID=3423409 RepID=UPI003F19E5CE
MPTTPAPTTPAPPTPTGQPPAPPTDFRVTAVTPTSVTLAWTAATPGSDPIAGYDVNYTQAFNDVYLSQPAGNVTTITISSSIRPTYQYRFFLLARDTAGRTASSPTSVTVVTPAAATGDTTPPSAPGNLRLTAVTPAGPALAWDASTDDEGVTAYDVFFFDGWFSSTLVGTTTGTQFVAPFRSGGFGTPAYYVRARDAAGNLSIASNTVSAPAPTTPPPPPPSTCRVAYRTTAEWAGGFVAEVTITNTGTTAVEDWSLSFAMPGDQQVSSAWNASIRQEGATVMLTAARWNATIRPGATVAVGLLGRWTRSNTAPAAFTLAGSPCAAG